jgi:hypothetical protein
LLYNKSAAQFLEHLLQYDLICRIIVDSEDVLSQVLRNRHCNFMEC